MLYTRHDTQHEKSMTLIRKENIKFEYKYFKNAKNSTILLLEVKNPVSSYTSIALLKIESQRDLPNIFPPFFILLLLKRPRKRQNTKILKSCSFDFCRHQTSFIVDLLTITLAHQLINFNNFQTYILTSGETSLSCSSSCYK